MTEFVSFDGGVRLAGGLARPERYRSLTEGAAAGARIARGAGLSYSAASFGGGALSVEQRRFNRVLDFDAGGLVRVEPGISLGELFDFLAPRGLYLAVQPGHPAISVGGCVAADAHGKNQLRDGSFSAQVEALTLFHPLHGALALSRNASPELFALTCGGFGLTGTILDVTLRPRRLPGAQVEMEATPLDGLRGLAAKLEQGAARCDSIYSWHDLSPSAAPFGRGVLLGGRFTGSGAQAAPRAAPRRLASAQRGGWRPPLLNRATGALMNAMLLRSMRARAARRVALDEALFPLAGRASRYFDLYGRRGFHEYQVLVPAPRFDAFAADLEQWVRERGVPVTLASAKYFGGRQDYLRFDGAGVCFALNLPRNADSAAWLARLDELTIGCGGIPNIIKDSRLPREVAQRAFGEYERFRSELRAFDPQRLYRSELSERLGL